MRTSVALFVGAVLLGGFVLGGSVTAAQSADSTHNGTDTGDNDTEVGICVIGVDSPCNGDEWDGDENDTEGGSLQPVADGDESDDSVEPRTDDKRGSVDDGQTDSEVGICLLGADTACNTPHSADAANGFVSGSPIETVFRAIRALL